jgi:GT2 family glycosyltransferase
MDKKPLVSIITINYKQALVTNELLESMQKVTWPDYEIVIVDNASGEEDRSKINRNYPNNRLILSEKNLGFAGGNNLGIKNAKGDYILLLNNDTEVEPGFIEPMIELFENNPEIGAISPKIKFFYDKEKVQYAGYSKMNTFTLRLKGYGFKKTDDGSFNQKSRTHYAHGCAMMVPRKVIESVGLMPEAYFLYYEEHDWCAAIKRKGLQIWYQPASLVWHKESVSVKKESTLKTYFMNRNRILFMKRNFNLFQKIVSSLYLFFISVPINILRFLFKKQNYHLQAYLDGIMWNINHKTKDRWKF